MPDDVPVIRMAEYAHGSTWNFGPTILHRLALYATAAERTAHPIPTMVADETNSIDVERSFHHRDATDEQLHPHVS